MENNLETYKQKMVEFGGTVSAMREMEEKHKSQNSSVNPNTTNTMDDAARRKRLDMLLDRNKNKKKKTRR
jgi:hypothetical protein